MRPQSYVPDLVKPVLLLFPGGLLPQNSGPSRFAERKQEAVAARRFNNAIPYQDVLPQDIRENLASKYKDKFDKINYVDTEGFHRYLAELENEDTEINLKISPEGEWLSETIEKD